MKKKTSIQDDYLYSMREYAGGWPDEELDERLEMIKHIMERDQSKYADTDANRTGPTPKRPTTTTYEELESMLTAAMEALEQNELEDFVLLKNDKLRAWWTNFTKKRAARIAAEKEKARKEEVKRLAKERYDQMMAGFTEEEKKLLGINK